MKALDTMMNMIGFEYFGEDSAFMTDSEIQHDVDYPHTNSIFSLTPEE